MMLRRDDPQFKALVDEAVAAVMRSGEIERIYDRWFVNPIPPRGTNLSFPMTPAIRDAFASPNDKGV
jgi:glutamate/aspartate transport system substrate-binding protein